MINIFVNSTLSDYMIAIFKDRHSGMDCAGIRTPVRAYYQYGESPYQSKSKTLKLKVIASPRGGVGSNWK
jgi:hypothetical protein